jgi:hypothetical protein
MLSSPSPSAEAPDPASAPGDVLILAYSYPPDNEAGALRPFRFAKFLPAYGFSTHVITAIQQDNPGTPGNVHYVPDWMRDRPGGARKVLRKLEAQLLRVAYSGGGQPCLSWAPGASAAAERLINPAPGPWYVLSTYPPLCTHIAARRLKRRYGDRLRWIADFRDPLAGNPVSGRAASFLNARIEQSIFRDADRLIANTDTAADRWRSRYPQWAHKISHIWNGYDPEQEARPLPIPLRDYKTIVHVGEIYGGRDPNPFLVPLARLLEAGADDAARVRVELIGDLNWRSIRTPDLLKSLMLRGKVALSEAPRSPREAVDAMGKADALLLLDLMAGLQVPSKLFVYVRIGRPILAITAKGSPVDRILGRAGVPYACLYPEDTAEEADAKVKRFLDLPNEPARASEWFFHEFDGKRQVGALAALLGKV